MENKHILSLVILGLLFFYLQTCITIFLAKKAKFKRDGKLFSLGLFNFINYFIITYGISIESTAPMAIAAAFLLICFSFATCYFYARDINKSEIRFYYRLSFAFSMFIFPMLMLDIDRIDRLCLGWAFSYFACATINRLFSGKFAENDIAKVNRFWLRSENSTIFKDIVRFRSEFSLNTPGGHREVIESFYPYLISICLVVTGSTHVLNLNGVSMDYALSIVDSSVLGQIVAYDKIEGRDTGGEYSSNLASNGGAQSKNHPNPIITTDTKTNRMIVAIDDQPIRSLLTSDDRKPNTVGLSKTVDMIALRNLVFLLLILVTAVVLNSRGIKHAYIDKWKLLQSELNALYEKNEEDIKIKTRKKNEKRKILFASNLIVTEMWGHRSFSKTFKNLITELEPNFHSKDKKANLNYTPKELLTALQNKL